MASELTIKVGPLTRTLTAQASDAQVGEMLKAYAFATGAPLDATNAQLADHVLRAWIEHAVRIGRQYRQRIAAEEAAATAEAEVRF